MPELCVALCAAAHLADALGAVAGGRRRRHRDSQRCRSSGGRQQRRGAGEQRPPAGTRVKNARQLYSRLFAAPVLCVTVASSCAAHREAGRALGCSAASLAAAAAATGPSRPDRLAGALLGIHAVCEVCSPA